MAINAEALIQVYLRRPDLQAVYNPDGTAKNPRDPRVKGIPNIRDWATKYGVNEEPSLTQSYIPPQPRTLENAPQPQIQEQPPAMNPIQARTLLGMLETGESLRQVYRNRPDLQALYNPDGTAKNPRDPRVRGIPTLADWAAKYGINEEPLLRNLQQPTPAPTPAPNEPSPNQQNPLSSTGNALYDALISEAHDFINKLKEKGQIINPNVEITPEKLAEFTSQAVKEIHPYFATQFKAATDTFLRNLGYSAESLAQQEQTAQAKYGRSLETLASSSAEKGLAQSGIRQKQEGVLAQNTQNALDIGRRQLTFTAANEAANFARQYGGTNLPTTPTLGPAPRVFPGEFKFDTTGLSQGLYNLNPDIYSRLIGSEQNVEKSATETLASKLAENYTTGLVNQQTRALVF